MSCQKFIPIRCIKPAHNNVILQANEVCEFLALFEYDENFLYSTLPIGAGLFLAIKQI